MNKTTLPLFALALLPAGMAARDGVRTLPTSGARPNVLVIMTDDVGYGDFSCYGANRVKTPNIDRLAANGTRFTDAHACASTSTPSRYGFLTGEYPFRRPGTDVAAGNAAMVIRPEQFTLAEMFKEAGYATAAIGKWHLGLGSRTAQQDWNGQIDLTPAALGFEYSCIMAATADRVPCVYIENGRVRNYDPSAPIEVSYRGNFAGEPTGKTHPELLRLRPSHGHDMSIVNGISRIGYMKGGGNALWKDENIADSIVSYALNWIDASQAPTADGAKRPFFMYLCTNDVHVPRWPHERFRGKSPMGLRGEAILQLDWTVGRVLDHLRELGIADNTLVILTSDNGPVLDDGYADQAEELAGTHRPGGPWRGGNQRLRGRQRRALHRELAGRRRAPRPREQSPRFAHRRRALAGAHRRSGAPRHAGLRQSRFQQHLVGTHRPLARLPPLDVLQSRSEFAHPALEIHSRHERPR